MNNYIQDQNKFEFLLKLDGNIICQRYFNVKDYNPKTRRSMNLHEEVKYICLEISDDLKLKSSDYLAENQAFFMNNDFVEDPKEMEEQYFNANWAHFLEKLNNVKSKKQLSNFKLDELIHDLRYVKKSKVFVFYSLKSDQFKLLVVQ